MKNNNLVYLVIFLIILALGFLVSLFFNNLEQKVIEEQHFCSPQEREGDVCIQLFQPVCGWFNPERVQCIKYPCAQTFSNSCFSCQNSNVLYWTEGECPTS